MASSPFPTKLSDLKLNDSTDSPSFYAQLRSIKKSTLSVRNRLTSIVIDAKFVKSVSDFYRLPLVANERCGSWYIDPRDKAGSAYFKSTDGHHGIWSFSLRRLNLQLLPILGQHGGAVIVDSTRRGKNLPDAFSKTVPIWVAVLNRALFPESKGYHGFQGPPPPDDLGKSEISQIEAKLDGFVQAFLSLNIDPSVLREQLKRPIRVHWVINTGFDLEKVDLPDETQEATTSTHDHRLVLCSASHRVHGAEVSEGGYIQGAGDDSEGWSHGLDPTLFWKHQDNLMMTSEEDLPDLIKGLLAAEDAKPVQYTLIQPTTQLYIGAGPALEQSEFHLIVNCQGKSQDTSSKVLNLDCRAGKLGSKDLRQKLPSAVHAISNQLQKDPQSRILVTCTSGRDLSAGVVATVLCLLFSDDGTLHIKDRAVVVDKHLVKQRLVWITSSKSDVNPSRSTLQAVNTFLMPP
ncbi:hypothetical protein PV10_05921 [Exophiala mesophila]|uniref:Initiator tRNA phosphoribosyl transferase n=1 Tax=Exophiala mesophila TaxID=212818 RepID=A0A0D1Z9I4_EXOME|nr:uncharacterized protein PV10_05921 [Exophiala mesophila]KIV91377.1 hypothetical protein PV10_05921 [Exophiala mesophila]